MAPPAPRTSALQAQIVADIEAAINQTVPLLPKAFNRVTAKILAGVLVVLYKYASYIFLQIFVATASFDKITVNSRKIKPLVFWGRLINIGDPDPAVQAQLLIDITVKIQGGTLKASETTVVSTDNNITYSLNTDLPLDAELKQGIFTAVSDPAGTQGAGIQGNLTAGSVVSFTTPYEDVEPDAIVNSIIVSGVEGESEEIYRQRIENRFGGRPQGGAGLDYVYWAKEVPGVINVYPYTGDPGEVDVYSEVTATPTNPDGIPTPAELILIKEAIEKDTGGLAWNRPVGSFVNSYPISRSGFTVDITDLTSENLAALKISLETALTEYFLLREPFIDGVTPLPRKQNISQDDVRGIVNDYATADNGIFSSVIVKFTVSGVPFQIYTLLEGEKAKLTAINYLTTP